VTDDPNGRQFVYDAENKQVKVLDAQNATIGEYFYDGDGRRVKKVVPSTGEVTIFVYDASAKLIEEYSTIVETTNAKVGYVTNDHLGSPRINTDANGAVTSRHDYHPFGEDIATSQRMSELGYIDDTVRKQFTGYERENESGLDYAAARYYNSGHGRFNTSDPIYLKDDRLNDPQRLNLYTYVRNSPLSLTDPTGLDFQFTGKDKDKSIVDVNNRDKAGFQVELDADGVVRIVDLDKVDRDKLSDADKALYDAIRDPDHRAVLVGVGENSLIDFGGSSANLALASSPGVGLNFIDSADMATLRAASPTAAGEIMGHEMMEAYAQAQTGSLDYDKLHNSTTSSFPGPRKDPNFESLDRSSPDIAGGTVKWTLTRPKTDITIAITYKFNHSIPRASIAALPIGRTITNIQVVKKK
jgi:RHS repeat-associated protein